MSIDNHCLKGLSPFLNERKSNSHVNVPDLEGRYPQKIGVIVAIHGSMKGIVKEHSHTNVTNPTQLYSLSTLPG